MKRKQPTRRELLRTLEIHEHAKGECARIRDVAGKIQRTVERILPSPFVGAHHAEIDELSKELRDLSVRLRNVYQRVCTQEEQAELYEGETE